MTQRRKIEPLPVFEPVSDKDIATISQELWAAMATLSYCRHRTRDAEEDCRMCRARKHITKAYQLLPPFKERPIMVVPDFDYDEPGWSCPCAHRNHEYHEQFLSSVGLIK